MKTMMIYKHVKHLAKSAHSYCFISVCGIRINYPMIEGSILVTHEECDEAGIPRRIGDLKEVNCKACQRTFIFKEKLKQRIVSILLGEK